MSDSRPGKLTAELQRDRGRRATSRLGHSTCHWRLRDARKPGTGALAARRPSGAALTSQPSEHECPRRAQGQIRTASQPPPPPAVAINVHRDVGA